DEETHIVTTPAYMCDARPHEVFQGIGRLVEQVVSMTGGRNADPRVWDYLDAALHGHADRGDHRLGASRAAPSARLRRSSQRQAHIRGTGQPPAPSSLYSAPNSGPRAPASAAPS